MHLEQLGKPVNW